jgi:hypothetical protein
MIFRSTLLALILSPLAWGADPVKIPTRALPCSEGPATGNNLVRLGKVTRVSVDLQQKILLIHGQRFMIKNSATSDQWVEKKSRGVLVIPISAADPTKDAALKNCASIARASLAQGAGYQLVGRAPDFTVQTGPATILSLASRAGDSCVAVAGTPASSSSGVPPQNAWIASLNPPASCESGFGYRPTGLVSVGGHSGSNSP